MKIFDNENYIKIEEWNEAKIIKINYMHKKCWLETMDSKSMAKQAMGMLKGVKSKLQEHGMLPEEEIHI